MNNNEVIEYLLQQKIQNERNKNKNSSIFDKWSDLYSKAQNLGNNTQLIGNGLKGINNETVQKIGSNLSDMGNNISTTANQLSPNNYLSNSSGNVLNNDVVNKALSETFPNILSNTTGAASTGSALGNTLGAEAVGTAAGSAGASAAGTAAEGAATGLAGMASAAMPIAAAVMAIKQKSDKRRAETENTNLQQLQEIENLSKSALNDSNNIQGNYTGGAAPLQISNNFPTTKDQFSQSLKQVGWDNNTINSALNGLNLGSKEMSDYINSYNQNAQDGQKITIPQTNEEIEAARKLAGGISSKEENVTQNLLNKFISGISDLSKGYQENKTTGFSPENLAFDSNKNNMTRIGEGIGTLAKIAQTPAAQGIAAGLISGIGTGNALTGIANGYKYANQRALSDVYNQVLKDYGIDVNTGTFGNLSSGDVNTLLAPKVQNTKNDIELKKLQQNIDNAAFDRDYKTQKLAIDRQNAKSNAIKAKNSSNKGSRNNTTSTNNNNQVYSGETVIIEAPNGKKYKIPIEDIKKYKTAGGKVVG